MNIKKVTGAKKEYIDLLLLADEQENMIDKYLENGEMFVLVDNGIKAECVITKESDSMYELKNIAVLPECQRKGYGKSLVEFLFAHYSDCDVLIAGTGDCPSALSFYNSCGFTESHRIKNFFIDNYDHSMFEDGIQLVDMVYLSRSKLNPAGSLNLKGENGIVERPNLNKNLDSKTFRDYYYLKEELVDFCRENGLPVSGGKIEITDMIVYFLDTGKVLSASIAKKKAALITNIEEAAKIESDFVCSEKHRAFFKKHIGNSFSFNVAFQKWLKSNGGKTYKEAIIAYYQILEDKKNGKTKIDKQFEYNTYIRDFFADNQGKSLEQAIKCWNYKKQLQGHNRYERTDLAAME